MPHPSCSDCSPRLLWIFPGELSKALDSATWLETTRNLRRLGWRVDLGAAGPAGTRALQGVDVIFFPTWDAYLLRQLLLHLHIIGYILRHWREIDVILFHQESSVWLLPVRQLLRLSRKRPLFVLDTRDRTCLTGGARNRLRLSFEQVGFYLANRWADGQTAITRRMAELIRIPQKQLWGTWPSGVTLERFVSNRRSCSWPPEDETIHLVYIGSLAPLRNLRAMCLAVQQANASGMRFQFCIYGDGPARADLETLASHTTGQVRVCTPIPHDEVPMELAKAHIGVTAMFSTEQALFQASSPIKLFEYMAAGLPILAIRMACHVDVVGHGKYAFWVERSDTASMLDALRQIWATRDSLRELGNLSQAAAAGWTWRESAIKLKTALEHGLEARS